jgi:hypothetical protein
MGGGAQESIHDHQMQQCTKESIHDHWMQRSAKELIHDHWTQCSAKETKSPNLNKDESIDARQTLESKFMMMKKKKNT